MHIARFGDRSAGRITFGNKQEWYPVCVRGYHQNGAYNHAVCGYAGTLFWRVRWPVF